MTGPIETLLQNSFRCFVKEQGGGSPQLEMSDATAQSLGSYLELLNRWNQKMDLVSAAPLEVLASRHILDSAYAWALLKQLNWPENGAVMDVGSGAGLPGVVFAILEPAREHLLCEPRDKRASFLREVKRALGLNNVVVEQARLDGVHTQEKLALLITRATALRQDFLEYANSCLLPGGMAVEMRGKEISERVSSELGPEIQLKNLPQMSYKLGPEGLEHRLLVWKCFT